MTSTLIETFEELFKDKLKNDINEMLLDEDSKYNFVIDTDLNNYLSKSVINPDTIVAVLKTGNARQMVAETLTSYSQSMSIIFAVPDSAKKLFRKIMLKYTQDESTFDLVQTASPYYFSLSYSTIALDGISFNKGGAKYFTGALQCQALYSISQFDLGKGGKFYIKNGSNVYTEIKNIMSVQVQKSPVTESFSVIGKQYQGASYIADAKQYTLNILVDKSNALHQRLIDISNDIVEADMIQEIKFVKGETNKINKYLMTISLQEQQDNFKTLSMVLVAIDS